MVIKEKKARPLAAYCEFLVTQLQHFHCQFFLRPGKKSKEEDAEKIF